MYVKSPNVEDIPSMIKIMRESLYPDLDRRKISYDSVRLESALRRNFHSDHFSTVLNNGRCRGFIWTTLDSQGGKVCLKILVMSVEASDSWKEAVMALLGKAREYASSGGVDYTQVLRLREKPVRNVYCDEGSREYSCKMGLGR